ncbi:MAG: Gfo/Idh/MocA family oxidoreductase [Candidatus Hydrogenedentota bacterium]
MSQKNTGDMRRRDFLKSTAAAAAFSIVPAKTVRGTEANSTIELGIVGSGQRGVWIGMLFEEYGNAKVVAVHDYFRDRVEKARDDFGVDEARGYIGLEGYHELVNSSLDAVAIESPPYFHPAQSAATLDAGKHVFIAKPMAVDAPGCDVILEAAKRREGELSAWVDFQTRVDPLYQEAAQRLRDGHIGAPVCGQCFYYAGRLHTKTEPGEPHPATARLRNWYFDKALSGDIIVEQNIHMIDVATWFLDGQPLEAFGTGGRKARTDVGDCWDHFAVIYTYPDEVRVDFSSGQFVNGYNALCTRIYGSEGTVESNYGGEVYIDGRTEAWKGGQTSTIYQDGAIANIELFRDSILNGAPINNIRESADSTLASILGRTAAYRGEKVTWDDMLAEAEELDPDLDLPEDGTDHEPVH